MVYLDDERPCPDGWTPARTAAEAIALLRTGNVTHLSLDHDLGEGPSGYDVVCEVERALAEDGVEPPEMSCHSANPVGRARIEQAIAAVQRRLVR
jgi:hypothetical protein